MVLDKKKKYVQYSLHIGRRQTWFENFIPPLLMKTFLAKRFWYGGLDFRYFHHSKSLNWTKQQQKNQIFHFGGCFSGLVNRKAEFMNLCW